MLVLSRKKSEKIMIGDGIVVTVCNIKGHAVRLGIEAPPGVAIHREEVYENIKNGVWPEKAVSQGEPAPELEESEKTC